MNTNDVNKQVYMLNNSFLKAINYCNPLISRKIKGMLNKWINGTIKQKIKGSETKEEYLPTG